MDSKTTTKFDQHVVKTTDKEGSEIDSVEGKQQTSAETAITDHSDSND